MSRYRALTLRYPHLTEAEEVERRQLALAGWHEALAVPAACTCQRQPGDDTPRIRCAECEAEEAAEALDLVTVADVLRDEENRRKVAANGLRSDRLAAALDALD